MRRKDREITDLSQIRTVIEKCKVVHLGLVDEAGIYVVPMDFGYELENGKLTLYMHCAKEGRRLSAIAKDNRVGFEMDDQHEVYGEGDVACKYGRHYASVIGNGIAELLEDPAEKVHALKMLMLHETGREFEIPEQAANSVGVIRITSNSFSCKKNYED